jgi:D-xylose transport system permease protein
MAGMGGESGRTKATEDLTGEDLAAQAEAAPDLTAAAVEVIPPEIVAQSLSQYLRGWFARVKAGDAGLLPVVAALVAVVIVFEFLSPNHVYLSPRNLVDLFSQSTVFIILAIGEGFVLLLGEIDLSIGYVAAIGGIVAGLLVQPQASSPDHLHNWPWLGAVLVAVLICAVIGAVHGFIITRLKLPSFVVTLAGQMFWFGMMIIILGQAGGLSVQPSSPGDQKMIYGIVYDYLDVWLSWIGLAVIVLLIGGSMWMRDASRRRSGLVAPPVGLTIAKIGFLAVAGIVVVAICNIDRRIGALPIIGVPWVVPLVLGVVGAATLLLERTQFGRHMYAVGGNPEAARRAGVGVTSIRTWAFVISAATAGIGGIVAVSYQGGITTNFNGGQEVLYAVAAAVIGGTSLMGGRGRAIHGLIGGLTIGAIYNGLYLLGLPVQYQYIATALVLLAAVAVDALARRNATSGSLART